MATLRDVMTKNVVVAQSSSRMDPIRRLMVDRKISRVVIVNEVSRPVGIITAKDFLRYTLSEEVKNLDGMIAQQMMSKPLVKESETAPVPACAKRMLDAAISSVVVVQGEALAGIVTKTDLCRFYAASGSTNETVRRRMTVTPITVKSGQRIMDAARIMVEHNISRIPVFDRQLEGIVTISDLTAVNPALKPATAMAQSNALAVRGKIVLPKDIGLITVREVMTPKPITILDDSFLSEAARLMIANHISGLPVLDAKGSLVGIVTKTDILKAIAGVR